MAAACFWIGSVLMTPSSRMYFSASAMATKPPVMEAVRVPPSAWMTSQSMVSWFSPRAVRSTTERRERPMRRWISCVRPDCLPRATHSRSSREAAKGKQSGRTQEIQRLIGRSLRAVIDLKALGERQITIDCDVIQADGGTRTAAITGAFVAAQDAVHWLLAEGRITSSPVLHPVAAVSVGIVNGQPVLDLDYPEDSGCDTDMNVVMNEAGHFIELQGTAEGDAFDRSTMNHLLDLADAGIRELIRLQKQSLGI